VTDRPRLIGWSSLHLARHRSLTSHVVATGTAEPVPGPVGSGRDALPCGSTPNAIDPRDQDRLPAAPCGSTGLRSGCLPSCGRSAGLLQLSEPGTFSGLKDVTRSAHRSHLGAATACVSTSCGALLGQRHLARLALRLAVRCGRAMRRTDFCHLTTSYPYSRFVGSGRGRPLSRPRSGTLSDFTSEQFASAGST